MTKSISKSLTLILKFLNEWDMPVGSYLNEGLSQSEIEECFQAIDLKATDELIELFQYKNGTKVSEGTSLDDIQLIPGFHFLSLQHAIKDYLIFIEDEQWNPLWFPVFANGGGDFYAVDLSDSDGHSAPILGFIMGESEQEIEYESLSAMLRTFSECVEAGIVFKSPNGFLEMDDSRLAEVAARLNPFVDFWKN